VLALGRYGARHPGRLLGVVVLLALTAFGFALAGIQLWAGYHLRAASFRSQAPCVAHFGLAGADRVRRLTIRWPSGTVQALTDLPADRHVVVTEGKGGAAAVEPVVPGRTIQP
jgi:hypothetical protein